MLPLAFLSKLDGPVDDPIDAIFKVSQLGFRSAHADEELVLAGISFQRVISFAAIDRVVAIAAEDRVIAPAAVAAVDELRRPQAANRVIAVAARERVKPGSTDERVVPRAPQETEREGNSTIALIDLDQVVAVEPLGHDVGHIQRKLANIKKRR